MENITLTVRPEMILATANEMDTEKVLVSAIMEEAKAKIASLTGVWQSSASDEFQLRFRQVYSDIDGMLATISQYVRGLTETADLYSHAEQAATITSQELPTSGVFR